MRFSEQELDALRSRLPDYLRQVHGIDVQPGRNFRCLFHKDQDPSMAFERMGVNGQFRPHVHCFGCGEDADIFELVQHDFGLSDFPSAVRKAVEVLGDTPPTVDSAAVMVHPAAVPVERKDHRRFVMVNAQNIGDQVPSEYLKQRGISVETARKYHVGFFPDFNEQHKEDWPYGALIIPTVEPDGRIGFVARNPSNQGRRYQFGAGCSGLFNFRPERWRPVMPIFVTEGALDALSIIEAGGNAVGLNSASNIQTFLDFVDASPNVLAYRVVVAWLDNDSAGREATEKLKAGLAGRGIPCLVPTLWYFGLAQMKDPNQALVERQSGFLCAVRTANELFNWDAYTASMAWTG